MARQESHHEDILAEATALVERIEIQLAGQPEPTVIGFRRGGEASIYFGQDLAYHFNAAGQLRRGFRDGELLKADSGQLIKLTRRRTDIETQLVRRELDESETVQFLTELNDRLALLREAAQAGAAKVLRQVPPEAKVLSRVAEWLTSLPEIIAVARHPRVA
jgi:hypothetical protein